MVDLLADKLIFRPLKEIFEFVSMPENDFLWQYGTLASARIPGASAESGSFFRSIGHFMGRRFEGTFEITEYEYCRKYGYKSLSGPISSQTLYIFDIFGGGVKISVSTHASTANLIKVNEKILQKQMKRQLKENLEMLKNVLETPVSAMI